MPIIQSMGDLDKRVVYLFCLHNETVWIRGNYFTDDALVN